MDVMVLHCWLWQKESLRPSVLMCGTIRMFASLDKVRPMNGPPSPQSPPPSVALVVNPVQIGSRKEHRMNSSISSTTEEADISESSSPLGTEETKLLASWSWREESIELSSGLLLPSSSFPSVSDAAGIACQRFFMVCFLPQSQVWMWVWMMTIAT